MEEALDTFFLGRTAIGYTIYIVRSKIERSMLISWKLEDCTHTVPVVPDHQAHGHYLPKNLTSLGKSKSNKPMQILIMLARSN